MKPNDHYNKGLLFLTYILISSDKEISDNELYYLHKMRVEEGMTDDTFAEYFKSLIGKSEEEIYQIGIDSLNFCSDELKYRAFSKLNQMALSDKVLSAKEVRFIFYAINLSHEKAESYHKKIKPRNMAA
jgi:hypothetical protein